mmetsp:Transcript_15155/g.28965  ORF Transcript_15155/g.28965 Transcript_15155/m.28965 type:complete len:88 (+) Transcript_15155:108-371(+)
MKLTTILVSIARLFAPFGNAVMYMSTSKEVIATTNNNNRHSDLNGGINMMYDEILLHEKGGYLNYEQDLAGKGRLNASVSGAIRCLL